MKILIEDLELVHSGVVIQVKNYPIKVILPDNVEGDFTFIFNFLNDVNQKSANVKYNSIDKFILGIDFINFENQTSLANVDIVEVGTLKKRKLYFNYRVFMHINTGKTLIFNFYVGKEVHNG
jgi:hypothetical protein